MRLVFAAVILVSLNVFAQPPQKVSEGNVSESYVADVLLFLASDSLKGRGNYTPELLTAAQFIAGAFERANLQPYPGETSFLLPFTTKKVAQDKLQKDSAGNFDPALVLYNVVGYLPADIPTEETIIFSAHYDHMGTQGKRRIYNGANDNASGTAAVLALAQHYSGLPGRKRNLLFCAFAGEELGLLGSSVFASKIDPATIVANINIEMIGIPVRKNSFFITGESQSDLGIIVRSNLKGSTINITGEPDESKRLFYRSDNFSFAARGIPAHSIMSSDDTDKCYHATCDDFQRLQIPHMVHVIDAIITGVSTLVDGRDTPARIDPAKL